MKTLNRLVIAMSVLAATTAFAEEKPVLKVSMPLTKIVKNQTPIPNHVEKISCTSDFDPCSSASECCTSGATCSKVGSNSGNVCDPPG